MISKKLNKAVFYFKLANLIGSPADFFSPKENDRLRDSLQKA